MPSILNQEEHLCKVPHICENSRYNADNNDHYSNNRYSWHMNVLLTVVPCSATVAIPEDALFMAFCALASDVVALNFDNVIAEAPSTIPDIAITSAI
jgi:hypothetical protein